MLYYFTYGADDNQPFHGGWTEVNALDIETACEVFSLLHPMREGYIHCASIYTEQQFKATDMYVNGNFGHRCHERIFFRHEILTHES